jgi:protein-S-isoprenylcysteine O-methyltransferase Ste14
MENNIPHIHKNKVHKILAASYYVFFFFFLVGVSLDLVFNFKIFTNSLAGLFGIIFLLLGTILIISAQKTSRGLKKENITKETFSHGPYRYTRSPTHWGLFLLVLGFGFITNAFFVITLSLISLLIARFVFLRKEEKILSEKYGAPYLEYQKSVKL